jgi:hypothetical protein
LAPLNTQRKPNDIDGEEGNNTYIARKNIFERLEKFHEWNTSFDGEVTNRNRNIDSGGPSNVPDSSPPDQSSPSP